MCPSTVDFQDRTIPQPDTSIAVIDNGSRRAAAVRSLRRIAEQCATRIGQPVTAVSLLHVDEIPPGEIDGIPALTLATFLRQELSCGVRDFTLLPLFFGPSRALTHFIPATMAEARLDAGPFQWRMASELCPLPSGEPILVDILADHCALAARQSTSAHPEILLVDHGSPRARVNQVRQWLAARLQERLGPAVQVEQAAMERRPGPHYDFNGPLLEEYLDRLGEMSGRAPRDIVLALLFLGAGRHAGADGDIATICTRIHQRHPHLRIHPTPLVTEHPRLIEILLSRWQEVSGQRQVSSGNTNG